ncbi:MAG: hypothetical protein KIT09_22900 [Bryobacteraceae bacterium]|nr:hypothetical protein [Bryobacteraceae bacterium]
MAGKWKKSVCFAAVALSVAGYGAYRAGKWMFVERTAHAQVNVQPFTMEQVRLVYDPDGKPLVAANRTTAVRADGSQATVEALRRRPGDILPAATVTRRLEMADGRYAGIVEAIGAKATGFLKKDEVVRRKMRFLNPPAHCANEGMDTFIREEEVGGVKTFVVERLTPNGEERDTFWRLPDYGCEFAQIVTEARQPDGSFRKIGETGLVYFSPGEPDPAYFDPSDKYKEMPPSAMKQEYLRSAGITPEQCSECFTNNWAAVDAEYLKRLQPE